jgi:hypothetical protein
VGDTGCGASCHRQKSASGGISSSAAVPSTNIGPAVSRCWSKRLLA